MKQYWLFANVKGCKDGGMLNFIGCFDSIEEAQEYYTLYSVRDRAQWCHILDTTVPLKIVTEYRYMTGWRKRDITLNYWKTLQ